MWVAFGYRLGGEVVLSYHIFFGSETERVDSTVTSNMSLRGIAMDIQFRDSNIISGQVSKFYELVAHEVLPGFSSLGLVHLMWQSGDTKSNIVLGYDLQREDIAISPTFA